MSRGFWSWFAASVIAEASVRSLFARRHRRVVYTNCLPSRLSQCQNSIDALPIKRPAFRVNGAAGPSGADVQAWKRFVTSFGAASDDLCSALACVARKIATSNVDPNRAYTACHHIALNKNPGTRPIGVGEAACRIIGKAILKVIKPRLEGHRKSTAMRRSRSGC